jgi:4-amino-4-deoxy-L-arabinose transferase-like glycosyltransferase
VAISLLANSDGGVWPFVAALALLGGLGRRAAGQPVMSRQRKWRVAIGLLMLVAVVVAGTIASSNGG